MLKRDVVFSAKAYSVIGWNRPSRRSSRQRNAVDQVVAEVYLEFWLARLAAAGKPLAATCFGRTLADELLMLKVEASCSLALAAVL